MLPSSLNIPELQHNILSWYKTHGRVLPWRQTQDPYKIWVSEVMLQQTQVDRVIPYFERRMNEIPDVQALAEVSNTKLLTHWSGLGFNSRALRLKACAAELLKQHGGIFPQEREALLQLPGIGPYTSAAILAFAFNIDVPVIDTNIRRVLIFLLKLEESISDKELEQVAWDTMPKGQARDWYNALMDYGAMELTARKTKIKPKSKQSKFEGSDRQVRGWILKYLVKHSSLPFAELQKEFPRKDVAGILAGMVGEGTVEVKDEVVRIVD